MASPSSSASIEQQSLEQQNLELIRRLNDALRQVQYFKARRYIEVCVPGGKSFLLPTALGNSVICDACKQVIDEGDDRGLAQQERHE